MKKKFVRFLGDWMLNFFESLGVLLEDLWIVKN